VPDTTRPMATFTFFRCAFTGICVLVVAVTLAAFCCGTCGRQVNFWWRVLPILLAYKRAEWDLRSDATEAEREETYEVLHRKFAPLVLQIVLSTKGMFLKMAQMASTRVGVVPLAYREELSKCTDHCELMPFGVVRNIVEKSLGTNIKDAFSQFDEEPLSVASVGQVHRAKVVGSGQEVAVKVKFPGVEVMFNADLRSLKVLVHLACMPQFAPFVDEWKSQLSQEFDYQREAQNLEVMSSLLVPRFGNAIEIPSVLHELTRPNMITMTFVKGARLDVAVKQRLKMTGVDIEKLEGMAASQVGFPGAKADKTEASLSSSTTRAEPVAHLATRAKHYVLKSLRGIAMDCALAVFRLRTCATRRPRRTCAVNEPGDVLAGLDAWSTIDTLIDIWGFAVFEAGTFNGDPHPGNVLLQADGRLGLIDYGQVKTLGVEVRQNLARVVIGVVRGDEEGTVAAMRRLGICCVPLPDGSASEWTIACSMLSREVPTTHELLQMRELVSEVPGDMLMVIRIAAILKGVSFSLGYRVSLATCWEKWAVALLADETPRVIP